MAGTNQTYLIYEWECDYPIAVCANEQLVNAFIDEYNKDGDKDVWYEAHTVIQYKGDTSWEKCLPH